MPHQEQTKGHGVARNKDSANGSIQGETLLVRSERGTQFVVIRQKKR